ncbi:MAG: hypothetical protein ACFFD1_11015 [Candidatus Thorarchaeota archaeon]
MWSTSITITDKSGVYEGVKQLISAHWKGKVFNVTKDSFNFQIGSILAVFLAGIPELVEGVLTFSTVDSSTKIDVKFTRNNFFKFMVYQVILLMAIAVIFAIVLNPLIMILGGIFINILAYLADAYYVKKVEENFIEIIKNAHFQKKPVGPKVLYTIATIAIFILAGGIFLLAIIYR